MRRNRRKRWRASNKKRMKEEQMVCMFVLGYYMPKKPSENISPSDMVLSSEYLRANFPKRGGKTWTPERLLPEYLWHTRWWAGTGPVFTKKEWFDLYLAFCLGGRMQLGLCIL
jgi:hypothetical protein